MPTKKSGRGVDRTSPATRPDHPKPTTKRRATFARQAVRLEFRARPHERLRHIGEVAAKVTRAAGQNSLRHRLNQAGQAETDEEREAALKIARNIARLAGLDAALIDQEVA